MYQCHKTYSICLFTSNTICQHFSYFLFIHYF